MVTKYFYSFALSLGKFNHPFVFNTVTQPALIPVVEFSFQGKLMLTVSGCIEFQTLFTSMGIDPSE
jgi:hypothetical protein